MDTIIVRIKCKRKYRLLNELRDQGLLFEKIRETLECDWDGVQELSWEEYDVLEKSNKDDKGRSN